jgi:predicted acetyltransferase
VHFFEEKRMGPACGIDWAVNRIQAMPFRLRDCVSFLRLSSGFDFLDPGPMVDNELELVSPAERWVDGVLAACNHPLTMEKSPGLANTTRRQIQDFLVNSPDGHQQGGGNQPPSYHFWMKVKGDAGLPIAGGIGLRVGNQYEVVMYSGHVGYHVYPPAQGHHYAERACRLLFPLARRHGMQTLWITCNPDNYASRRTCERLGGQLVEIVPVPEENPLYQRGEVEKCRYRIDL